MSAYNITLFVHISSALLLFFAFGIEWTAISFLGKTQSSEEAGNWLRLAKLAPIINGPALLVAILSGAYLASQIGAFKQGWVSASFIGIAIVAAIGGAINVPKLRAIRTAIPNGGAALGAALQTKALPVSVRLRTCTVLAIVYTMVVKTSLGLSMTVLGIGLIVGLLLSIPVLTRKAI
jgi:hypothetical protein